MSAVTFDDLFNEQMAHMKSARDAQGGEVMAIDRASATFSAAWSVLMHREMAAGELSFENSTKMTAVGIAVLVMTLADNAAFTAGQPHKKTRVMADVMKRAMNCVTEMIGRTDHEVLGVFNGEGRVAYDFREHLSPEVKP